MHVHTCLHKQEPITNWLAYWVFVLEVNSKLLMGEASVKCLAQRIWVPIIVVENDLYEHNCGVAHQCKC